MVQMELPIKKKTSKEMILELLASVSKPLAVHEMNIKQYSQNNIATRLSELAKSGKVIGNYRNGTQFKEWSLLTK